MIINLPEYIQDIYIQGDLHGAFELTTYQIKQFNIKNSVFIICGDCGFGFEPFEHYINNIIPILTKTLKKYNCIILYIRGNHENSQYFNEQLINTKYIKTIPDYSIIKVLNHNILCIGGGISIDRVSRKHNDSVNIVKYMKYHNCNYEIAEVNSPKTYWENEPVIYKPKVTEHIDIICSHSAPSFCFPIDKGPMVQTFATYDHELLKDIDNERTTLDKVYEDYKDSITH